MATTLLTSGITMGSSTLNVSGSAPTFPTRTWFDFDGTTNTIRASGNVTSFTDNGVGDFTVNMTTALNNANYVVNAGMAVGYNTVATFSFINYRPPSTNNFSQLPDVRTTTQFRLICGNSTAQGLVDYRVVAGSVTHN